MIRTIVLVGASVGRDWRFEEFPSRAGLEGLRCAYRGLFDFDKTTLVRELLDAPEGPPDVIVLKECAAYFPADPDTCRGLVSGWAERCRDSGVAPLLSTVAPVVRRSGLLQPVHDLARRLAGRVAVSERLDGIRSFNDWIREMVEREGLELLDLERVLRVGSNDRSLRPMYDAGDGLHLNQDAYSVLDQAMIEAVHALFPAIPVEGS